MPERRGRGRPAKPVREQSRPVSLSLPPDVLAILAEIDKNRTRAVTTLARAWRDKRDAR